MGTPLYFFAMVCVLDLSFSYVKSFKTYVLDINMAAHNINFACTFITFILCDGEFFVFYSVKFNMSAC